MISNSPMRQSIQLVISVRLSTNDLRFLKGLSLLVGMIPKVKQVQQPTDLKSRNSIGVYPLSILSRMGFLMDIGTH